MNKTLLIAVHEFKKTVKRTGFIILTLSLPVIALVAIGVLHLTSGSSQAPSGTTLVGYVDEAGGFEQFTTQGSIEFVRYDTEAAAKQALLNQDVTRYFIISPDFVSTGVINAYTTQKELAPPDAVLAAIRKFATNNLLAEKVSADVITRVENPPSVVTTTLTPTGEVAPQQAGYVGFIVPGIFSMFLALSLIFSATYVIQSLAEEKENRLMEILMSSISPRQLLTGKVAGLGTAGLLQVLVWVVSLPLLLKLASSSIGSLLSGIHVPAGFWALGIIYFILGYLLSACLSASIAAVTSSLQEAQGLAGIYTIIYIWPLWFVSLLILHPDSPVWAVFTIIPFSAPVLAMMRMGLIGVPAWQLALSIAFMVVSIIGGLWLAGRLLRTFMLMYGKRPGLGQIIRSLRSA